MSPEISGVVTSASKQNFRQQHRRHKNDDRLAALVQNDVHMICGKSSSLSLECTSLAVGKAPIQRAPPAKRGATTTVTTSVLAANGGKRKRPLKPTVPASAFVREHGSNENPSIEESLSHSNLVSTFPANLSDGSCEDVHNFTAPIAGGKALEEAHTDVKGPPTALSPSPDSSARQSSPVSLVVIWDLDETLILFDSLVRGIFARANQKSFAECVALGERMMALLMNTLEKHMFFHDLELNDQEHVSQILCFDDERDLSNYDFSEDHLLKSTGYDRAWFTKLSYRYRRIGNIYSSPEFSGIECLCPSTEAFRDRKELLSQIDSHSDGWVSSVMRILDALSAMAGVQNVLVTGSQLVPALAKNLLYDISKYFSIDNVYSSSQGGKRQCFLRIKQRFGPHCQYVAVGDGLEEATASLSLGMTFFEIRQKEDLQLFSTSVENGELVEALTSNFHSHSSVVL